MAEISLSPDRARRLALIACLALTGWRLAMMFASPVNLSFDEAQYWGWAQQPDWGYFSKPPMVAWAIWLTTALGGSDAEPWVRLSSPLAHGAIGMVLFALGRRLFTPAVGLWSAVLWVTLPGVAVSAMLVSTDPLLLLFWALALLAWVQVLEAERLGPARAWRFWLLLGLWCGLGLLSKYAMAYFWLGMAAHLALMASGERQRLLRRPGLWLSVLVALLIYAPNFWWNRSHGFASYRHTGENANLGHASLFNPGSLLEFAGSQFGVFGPLLFAVLLLMMVRFRRDILAVENRRLLAAFSLPPLLLITVQALLSRANANWAATAYVAALPLVTSWLVSHPGKMSRLLKASLLLHLLAIAALPNVATIAGKLSVHNPSRFDLEKRVRGWDNAGAWLRELKTQYPQLPLLLTDRKSYASLLYYARPMMWGALMYNPQGHVKNHYELTSSLTDERRGTTFLLVSRDSEIEGLRRLFVRLEPVSHFYQRLNERDTLELRAWRAEGFLGYTPDAPAQPQALPGSTKPGQPEEAKPAAGEAK